MLHLFILQPFELTYHFDSISINNFCQSSMVTGMMDLQRSEAQNNSQTIVIDAAGDLLLRVYDAVDEGTKATKAVYQVSNHILQESSTKFRTLLQRWKSTSSTEPLGVDHHEAFALWLQVLHNNIQESTFDMTVKEIWHAIQVRTTSCCSYGGRVNAKSML